MVVYTSANRQFVLLVAVSSQMVISLGFTREFYSVMML